MKRIYLMLVVLSLVALTTTWFVSRGVGQTSPEPNLSPTYRPDAIAANGVVEGVTSEVALRPEIAGTIRAIYVQVNERVTKGQLLLELENEVQTQQVALAKAEWCLAQAQLDRLRAGERAEKRQALAAQQSARKADFDHAERNWNRAEQLLAKSAISPEEHDKAYFHMQRARKEYDAAAAEYALAMAPPQKDDLDAAIARMESAKARWRLTQAELNRTKVYAPADGCILQVSAEPGDQTGPGASGAVLLFADLSRLRVRAFVEELDALRVRPGQTVSVAVDGLPGRQFRGSVATVLPRMGKRHPRSDAPGEYQDLYYREVFIDLANSEGLIINLRTAVRIDVVPAP